MEFCGCGILVVLLLSKECTASCLQRAFLIKGSWLFMTSSLGYSLCAGVVRGQISSSSDIMQKVLSEFCAKRSCTRAWSARTTPTR